MSQAYVPQGTARGSHVVQCGNCGLLQTIYVSAGPIVRHAPSVSTDAGWGNIRHGKALRVDATWPVVGRYLAEQPPGSRVLDVGTNRADFLKRASSQFPRLEFFGVEPDETLAHEWADLPGVAVEVIRLEDLALPNDSFNLIFCYHTLEHAASALGMLRKIREAARGEAVLLLEVPDVSVIDDVGTIEEFFIDKHSFHFSEHSLQLLLNEAGWEIIEDFSDGRNLSVACVASSPRIPERTGIPIVDLEDYGRRLARNRALLATVATQIMELESRQDVCLWGAARIYDALCRYGDLRLQRAILVDTYLARHLATVNGYPLNTPEIISSGSIDVCILLAKGAVPTLRQEAYRLGARHVTTFDDLFLPLVTRHSVPGEHA